jgi:hypothetical protein
VKRLTGLAVLALLAAGPAAAHRGHATLSVVEIDAATGAVTVSHRMAAHDVEPVLANIAPDAQPSLDDPDAVKMLVAYVGREFRIAGVPLTYAGQTLAGDTVVLRFTGRLQGKPKQLAIAGGMFGETHADHATQVNVRRAGVTRSLQFRPNDPPQTLALPGG